MIVILQRERSVLSPFAIAREQCYMLHTSVLVRGL